MKLVSLFNIEPSSLNPLQRMMSCKFIQKLIISLNRICWNIEKRLIASKLTQRLSFEHFFLNHFNEKLCSNLFQIRIDSDPLNTNIVFIPKQTRLFIPIVEHGTRFWYRQSHLSQQTSKIQMRNISMKNDCFE